MKSWFSRLLNRLPLVLGVTLLLLVACQLSQDDKVVTTISFNKLYDSLAVYDSVEIALKDLDGHTLDIVFQGKVKKPTDVENLAAPHWDGGKIIVSITGFKGDQPVYKIEAQFDGRTNKKDSVLTFILPGSSLSILISEFLLAEGAPIPFPPITIDPPSLADKTILWASSNSATVEITHSHIKAVGPGTAQVTAKLRTDPSKSLTIQVTVMAGSKIPEAINLALDTLYLAAGGASGSIPVVASPSTASNVVVWKIEDTTIASVSADGLVKGLKIGTVKLRANSKIKPSLTDSAWVVVSEPVVVESVHFLKDSVDLFIGGSTDSLAVRILPPRANPDVEFTVIDPLKVDLKGSRIQGLVEGGTYVIVKSKENPAKSDTLKVNVHPNQNVDSVRVSPKTLKLFVGGESLSLTGKVYPSSAPQKIQWRSGNPGYATVDENGKVTPVATGNLKVFAYSLADSLAKDSASVTVKFDPPIVHIGEDTVISVGQTVVFLPVVETQEYGVVTGFKWDLNGDGIWDDSAAAIKSLSYKYDQEKEYLVKFLVQDNEGNQTVVSKKVRAVKGAVVLILSPLNNSYSRQAVISVRWSVDGAEQDSLKTQTLKDGVNIITRTVHDAAGSPFSNSISVTLDSTAPNKPQVHGPALIASTTPTWTWSTGGAGANGTYRYVLDSDDFSSAIETKDTLFTPVVGLAEGVHSLEVQERDAAGNWSGAGKLAIRIDVTPPSKPEVRVSPTGTTNVQKPTFSWNGTGGGIGSYQYKVDNADFGTGATSTSDTAFTPANNLPAGAHAFYVREKDSTGNWSLPGTASLTIDLTAPNGPKLVGSSPTSAMPKWTWSSGGGAGSGDFRYKVGGDGNPATGGTDTRDTVYILSAAVSGTSYTLYVQERDAAGNWSAIISLPITYDLTKPTVAISSPQPSGNYLTRASKLDISGGSSKPAGGNPIQKITYTVDGVAGTLATNLAGDGSWSIKGLPLVNNKTIVLKVTAADLLGNTGEASLSLQMDSTAPATPKYGTSPPAVVNRADSRTSLQWNWNAPETSTDSFLVKLNGADVARQTGSTYTINNPSDGSYLLEIVEKDLAGNISVALKSIETLVDRTAPTAPALSKPASPRKTAQWTWTGGGGGSGTFQCQLDDGAIAGCTSPFNLPSPTDGDHSLNVRELDAAGNPSAWSTQGVTIDLQKPVIALTNYLTVPTQIFNTVTAFTGTAGDERSMRYVQYQVGSGAFNLASGATNWTFTPALDTGTQTITIRAEDVAGNQETITVQVTYEPLVVFVRKGATGAGNGTSWANAFSELGPVLKSDKSYTAGSQVWVSEGDYSPATIDGFSLRPDVSIYGGFRIEGTDRSIASRDLVNNSSQLAPFASGDYVISNLSKKADGSYEMMNVVSISDFKIIGAKFPVYISNASKSSLKNVRCQYSDATAIIFVNSSNVDISGLQLDHNTTAEGVIEVSGDSKIRILNTEINSNTQSFGGGITGNTGAVICAGSSSSISGNSSYEVAMFGGSFSRESSVTIGAGGISDETNTVVGSCPAPF